MKQLKNHYNYRYYSPELGRWLSRDPIGEKGGVNLYNMCANNCIQRTDYRGLFWPFDDGDFLGVNGNVDNTLTALTCSSQVAGGIINTAAESDSTISPVTLPTPDSSSATYSGWEMVGFVGGGYTVVEYCDGNLLKRMMFIKLCVGAQMGSGFSAGKVVNTNGGSCNADAYKGWFLETAGGEGAGVEFDIGYDDSNWGLPGEPTGVVEGGANISGGLTPFSSKWCYYIFVSEETIGCCSE